MGQDGLLVKILYIESCSKHAMQNNPGARAQQFRRVCKHIACMNTPAHSRYDSSDSAMEGSLSIWGGE